MNTRHSSPSSMSPLARLGVAALVGVVIAGAPMARASAAEHRDPLGASEAHDAPITALGRRLEEGRRGAADRLRALVQATMERAVQRVHATRDGMERALGDGLEQLASVETIDADAAEPSDAAPQRERPRRFEYVEGASDPLAGL